MRRRTALSLIVALVSLAGCVNDPGPVGDNPLLNAEDPGTRSPQATPTTGGAVLAIGDSLLRGVDNAGNLGAILSIDGWELETVAESGRSTRWAVDELEAREERVPRFVVVVLGTNPGFSSDGFEQDVEDLRAILIERGARRILWIPPHHPDSERYAEKLEILARADRAERRMVVAPWGAVLDAHPEWVSSDGIHLFDDGYAVMAVFIRDWLRKLV